MHIVTGDFGNEILVNQYIFVLVSAFMEIECKYAFLSTTKTKLTPSSRVHLEKAKVLQLVKKFPAAYGNRRIIIVFKRGRQLFLS